MKLWRVVERTHREVSSERYRCWAGQVVGGEVMISHILETVCCLLLGTGLYQISSVPVPIPILEKIKYINN